MALKSNTLHNIILSSRDDQILNIFLSFTDISKKSTLNNETETTTTELKCTLDIIYGLLWQLDTYTRKRCLELERTLSEITQVKATLYSMTLLENLSYISNSDPDQEMDSLTGRTIVLFQAEVKTFRGKLYLQLEKGFDNDIAEYSGSLIRDLLCVYGDDVDQYASELLFGFNKEMKIYIDDLVEKTTFTFDHELEEYSHELESAIEVESAKYLESAKDVESAIEVESAIYVEQVKEEESVNEVQSAIDEESVKDVESAKEVQSEIGVESAIELESATDIESQKMEKYFNNVAKDSIAIDEKIVSSLVPEEFQSMEMKDSLVKDVIDMEETCNTELEASHSCTVKSTLSTDETVDIIQKEECLYNSEFAAKKGKKNILKKMWRELKKLFCCRSG